MSPQTTDVADGQPGVKTTVIRADRLIDGTGAPPLTDPVVVIKDGLIAGVFQGEAPGALVAPGAEVVDRRGCTLLPGLIDCHVHLNFPADGTSLEEWMLEPDGVLQANSTLAAQTALRAGVTTVRDTGARGTTTFELRRALLRGAGAGPRLLLCGQPLTITGGHTWPLGGEADGVDGVRLKVRELAKLGADWIKVMATGGGTKNTMSWLPSYRPEELAAIVDEAHRLSRKVTVHCLNARGIESAIAAGADQLEHAGFVVDADGHQEFEPEVAKLMVESGIAVTATLSVRAYVVQRLAAEPGRSAEHGALLDHWKRMLDGGLSQFARMREMGVHFVAGTDAGWMYSPFDALPEEMALMHEGGMTSMEVITAATSRSAQVLGIGDRVGSVTNGLEADIIAVGADPLVDLRALREVRMVMQKGIVRLGGDQR